MESIGQMLKAARERRQISITDVAAATKMSSAYVQAIEADNFAALVAPIYARGFIKLYAECVGVDPAPLLKQFGATGRAAPAFVPPPSKTPAGKASVAFAGKLKPSHVPQSDPLPRQAAGKSGQEKGATPSKAAGRAVLSALSTSKKIAPEPGSGRSAWPAAGKGAVACLREWRLSVLARLSHMRIRWPQFNLPDGITRCFAWPAVIWRRILVLAVVVVLVIAAGMAWDWYTGGLPSTPDTCRWLADPPAPYLTMEVSAISPK